jgi:hypothetical protein
MVYVREPTKRTKLPVVPRLLDIAPIKEPRELIHTECPFLDVTEGEQF